MKNSTVVSVLTTENAFKLITKSKGRFFSLSFRKKDGTLRKMVAKFVDDKTLTNEKLVTVKEIGGSNSYRRFNIDRLQRFNINKTEYNII